MSDEQLETTVDPVGDVAKIGAALATGASPIQALKAGFDDNKDGKISWSELENHRGTIAMMAITALVVNMLSDPGWWLGVLLGRTFWASLTGAIFLLGVLSGMLYGQDIRKFMAMRRKKSLVEDSNSGGLVADSSTAVATKIPVEETN